MLTRVTALPLLSPEQTLLTEKQDTMDQLAEQKLLMETGRMQLDDMMSQLAREQAEADRNVEVLTAENEQLEKSISEMTAEGKHESAAVAAACACAACVVHWA